MKNFNKRLGKVLDTAKDKAGDIKDLAEDLKDKAEDKAVDIKDKLSDKVDKLKEKAKEEKPAPDPYLDEGLNILADYIQMLGTMHAQN